MKCKYLYKTNYLDNQLKKE